LLGYDAEELAFYYKKDLCLIHESVASLLCNVHGKQHCLQRVAEFSVNEDEDGNYTFIEPIIQEN
jgi:hypothetical protein